MRPYGQNKAGFKNILVRFFLDFFFRKFALTVFYGFFKKWLDYLESNLKSHLKKEVSFFKS